MWLPDWQYEEMNNVKKQKKPLSLFEQFRKQGRGFKVFYSFMWVLVSVTLITDLVRGQYENVFTCALTLFLFIIPLYIEHIVDIDLPDVLMTIIVLFIFAADILGEMNAWYVKIPWWDTMLHTFNGFLAAVVGFSLINILNNSDRLDFEMSPIFVVMTAFCFSMTIGVLWEFFEYGMDTIFLTDMQKDTVITDFASVLLDTTRTNTAVPVRGITEVLINGESLGVAGYLDIGIHDTMKDLIVNFIGAVVFSVFGYFYLKHPEKFRWFKDLLPTRIPHSQYETTSSEDKT